MICLSSVGNASVANSDSLNVVVAELRQSAERKDFSALRKYVSKTDTLYHAVCNSDVSVDLTVDQLLAILSKDSKRARIRVNENTDGGLVETVGWPGENTYLYFQFTQDGGTWKWLGVCESKNRPVDFWPASEK
jgi:hypothetical protein